MPRSPPHPSHPTPTPRLQPWWASEPGSVCPADSRTPRSGWLMWAPPTSAAQRPAPCGPTWPGSSHTHPTTRTQLTSTWQCWSWADPCPSAGTCSPCACRPPRTSSHQGRSASSQAGATSRRTSVSTHLPQLGCQHSTTKQTSHGLAWLAASSVFANSPTCENASVPPRWTLVGDCGHPQCGNLPNEVAELGDSLPSWLC